MYPPKGLKIFIHYDLIIPLIGIYPEAKIRNKVVYHSIIYNCERPEVI